MAIKAFVHRSQCELPEHMREALAWYQTNLNSLPPKITVHKSQVEAAEAALPAQAEIGVEGLGGCLINEIWLWQPEEDEDA